MVLKFAHISDSLDRDLTILIRLKSKGKKIQGVFD